MDAIERFLSSVSVSAPAPSAASPSSLLPLALSALSALQLRSGLDMCSIPHSRSEVAALERIGSLLERISFSKRLLRRPAKMRDGEGRRDEAVLKIAQQGAGQAERGEARALCTPGKSGGSQNSEEKPHTGEARGERKEAEGGSDAEADRAEEVETAMLHAAKALVLQPKRLSAEVNRHLLPPLLMAQLWRAAGGHDSSPSDDGKEASAALENVSR